ncbi:hypothetical protein OV203_26195 [Nannocystis sp. ILAH1]|uniref:hypothetical protein n=1 Tax=unclassified Nannocystis TaxID=2627009 RepID=UPI00226E4201|nr:MULTISPECIES: hypothetical protein [unclassified Nannocystis]MCY0990662.1 hypothetical protein [Nannocystis sp. ILAH1]MCY1072195.1 hypothetical protein [Nannocystis sp. RBIL2]
MRLIRSLSFVAVALSFGAVAFGGPSTAHAVICCSARPCQVDNPPSYCWNCNDECAEDEAEVEAPVAGEIVYDEVESLCYVAGTL